MMAMKDLFYLVNTFMNRSKSSDENCEITLPIEAAEDTRVLPGSNSSSAGRAKSGTLLTSLEPYQHLLPADLREMDLNQQKKLQKALYSAGVSAALSLQKLMQEVPKRKSLENANPDEFFPDDIEGKEILQHLSKSVEMEDVAKTFRLMSNNMEGIVQKIDGGKMLMTMISNELAAAALAAFASVTLRKPPTKHVESMMQTSQEIGPSMLDDGSEGSESTALSSAELKRSASVGKPPGTTISPDSTTLMMNVTAEKDLKSKQQRPSSCVQHNNRAATANENGGGGTYNFSQSDALSTIALADTVTVDLDENDDNGGSDDNNSVIHSEEPDEEIEIEEDEDSLFRYVCAAGYEDLAKLLVSMRNSAEFSQQSDSTPLMEACCGGHSDVVRTLIQAGADVNALSSTQNTALIYACASGHLDCVKELLASDRCDLNVRNESGHDAMMEAANIGNVDIMKMLILYGAKPSCVVDSVDYKESSLTLAAYKGHFEAVQYLLTLMPKVKGTQEQEELHTALMEASMDGHIKVAKLLLDADAKVNLSTESFENPLTLASCGGHIEMVKLLCEAGADLEEPNDEGYTPLMEASREGHHDVVEYLLNRGANVNTKIEEGLETSLTLAASGGFKNVVELLVGKGGDLTIGERTPLYEACQEGHFEVAQFIVHWLRNAYPITEIQRDLNEALLCASGIDNVALCNLLIENGAQIDCFSKENRTPLMEASQQNCLKVVELLIKKGADVNKIAPSAGKDVDTSTGTTKSKSSKKLTQKDCCPTVKCPCCIPPSLQKSAKEVCTAAGIPPAPYSTTTLLNSGFSSNTNYIGAKRPAVPSRSSTPNAQKCAMTTCKTSGKLPTTTNNQATDNKQQQTQQQHNSLSNSSSSATLSDPAAWMDNNVTCDTQNNDTALTLACVGGHTGLVQLLIKRGAHIEHRDKKGFTPLILAATGGHTEICRCLIEGGAQVDAQADRTKDTALSMACSGGRKDVVELLLKHNANKEHRNLSDYTPLSLAASGGYVDIIQLLLINGAEINSRTNSKLCITPLMLAAMNGHEDATRLLLENGADINAQIETNKNTALTLACFQGRAEVTKLLIQAGANAEHRAKTGLTPLMEAANGGYVEVGRVLLLANADVNTTPVPTSRDTALTIAADKGHYAFVDLLLDFDAQINARNKKGATALWLACNGGHLETVKVLVEHKADTEAQDNRKLTPLMVAFRKGHHKVVKYMVEHVLQFPSDADCTRYILTQTDPDLIAKCNQCIHFIKEAKAKQAEQANKAAASLLEMLAQEEAMEESRKRSKQRQKEKKKAKKQAKKENEVVGPSDQYASAIDETEENDSEVRLQQIDANAKEMEKQQRLELNQNHIELAQRKSTLSPQQYNGTTKSGSNASKKSRKELHKRVAESTTVTKPTKKETSNVADNGKKSSNGKTSANSAVTGEEDEWLRAIKKRASMVKSSESTKPLNSSTTVPPLSTSIKSESASTTIVTSSSTNATTSQTSVSTNSSNSHNIPPLMSSEEVDLHSASGRRPSLQVLNIAANAIPRVIGRAGANVNMIREVTGAHVEVEKQSIRKEQTIRKITIKGTTEAVRNAVKMINWLLKDHNILINEIVERVMSGGSAANSSTGISVSVIRKSPSLSTSSTDTPIQPTRTQDIRTPPIVIAGAPSPPLASVKRVPPSHEEMRKHSLQQQQTTPKLVTGKASALNAIKTPDNNSKNSSPIINATPTTNVWQKRAEAIRGMKTPQINLAVGENPHYLESPNVEIKQANVDVIRACSTSPAVAVPLKTTSTPSAIHSDVKNDENQQSQKASGIPAVENMSNNNHLAALLNEEHQRKAPGYARPQPSSANSQPQQNQMANQINNMPLENSTTLNGSSLFDAFAARWTTNPLELEESDTSESGTIQNSWSYLLEDRKSATTTNSGSGLTRDQSSTNALQLAALSAQVSLQQQQQQQQFHHVTQTPQPLHHQQQAQQQSSMGNLPWQIRTQPQSHNNWQIPPPPFVTPNIMQQQQQQTSAINNGGIGAGCTNRFAAAAAAPPPFQTHHYHHQQLQQQHPLGFGQNGMQQQQLVYPLCSQQQQQQQQFHLVKTTQPQQPQPLRGAALSWQTNSQQQPSLDYQHRAN